MKSIQWKEPQSNPRLEMVSEAIEIRMQPLAQEYGGETSMRYQIEILMSHSSGAITYQAQDISISPSGLSSFSKEMRQLFSKTESTARLAVLGFEFCLTLEWKSRRLIAIVEVCEFQSPLLNDSQIFYSTHLHNSEVIHQWQHQIDNHITQISNWLIENPAEGPVDKNS